MAALSTSQLTTARDQALAVLANITANPKPTYSIDGQRVAHGEYLKQLHDTIDWCERELAAAAPYEHVSRSGR